MKHTSLLMALITLLIYQIGSAQLTPEFLMPIRIQDAIGNVDTFWYGYDGRASYDTLNVTFGEQLITSPMDSVFSIRGYRGRDRFERKYPSKKIISGMEGDFCPFVFHVFLYVHAKYPPVTLSWDSNLFPNVCQDYRSEIISKDALPLRVQYWATETNNYTCMSFADSLVEDFAFRDTIPWGVNDIFVLEGGKEVTVHGYMIIALGFSECKQLVNTKNVVIEELEIKGNPVSERLVIDGLEGLSKLLFWEIYASNGIMVKTNNTWKGSLSVHDLATGQYTFVAHLKDGYSYAKFIKL